MWQYGYMATQLHGELYDYVAISQYCEIGMWLDGNISYMATIATELFENNDYVI